MGIVSTLEDEAAAFERRHDRRPRKMRMTAAEIRAMLLELGAQSAVEPPRGPLLPLDATCDLRLRPAACLPSYADVTIVEVVRVGQDRFS